MTTCACKWFSCTFGKDLDGTCSYTRNALSAWLGTNGDNEVTCSQESQKIWDLSIQKAELWCIVVGQFSAHLHTNVTSCAHLWQGEKRNVTGSACTACLCFKILSYPLNHSLGFSDDSLWGTGGASDLGPSEERFLFSHEWLRYTPVWKNVVGWNV